MSEPNPSPPGPAAGPLPGGYEPAPTRIGQVPPPLLLNRYQVIRLLGRGASGEVLEVRDLSTDIFYAFKRVAPEITRQSTQLQTLQSNFALVSQLAHPHIATTRFFERDPQNGDVCLLMDLVRGRSLAEYLADYRSKKGDSEAPLPVPVAVGIAEQIAAALDYAHAQPSTWNADGSPKRFGVLHRDLKPMNVMMESGREYRPGVPFVRLVDFGLAAEIQASLTSLSIASPQNNEICGTPGYMAPEQWEGRTLTRGVDQWALAVIIYEMVTGRPPFRAPSQMALMEQIRRSKPEKPATLSDAQWEALNKTFTVDRKNRYPSCIALVRAFAQADAMTMNAVQIAEQRLPDEDPTGTGTQSAFGTGTQTGVQTGTRTAQAFPGTTTTTVVQAPSHKVGLMMVAGAIFVLLLIGGAVAGFLWFQNNQAEGLRRAVNAADQAPSLRTEEEIAAALASLEQAERDYPYAPDSARVLLSSARERLRSRREWLARSKRDTEQEQNNQQKRLDEYRTAFEAARKVLEANNPDRLEEADIELAKAAMWADTPEKRQQVLDLRKQISQQIRDRKDLTAVLLSLEGLTVEGLAEPPRETLVKALESRYRILSSDRMAAVGRDAGQTNVERLTVEPLCQVAAKAGAQRVIRVAISPSGKGTTPYSASAELLAPGKGVIQSVTLGIKNAADFVDRIPLLISILHKTDAEKEATLARMQKREEERAAEQARLERERQELEAKQKELEKQGLKSDQIQKKLAEEKRKAEAAAELERQKRLEQERLAALEAAKLEAAKKAVEAAAARERELRQQQEREAQEKVNRARGTAQVRRVWVDHNQTLNNMKGMLIHVDFSVQWRKEIPGQTIAFFYWSNGEKALIPNDTGPYLARDGHVAVWDSYEAKWDSTDWKDFKLFMPYYRFAPGDYKFRVQIRTNNAQTTLAESEYVTFKISK